MNSHHDRTDVTVNSEIEPGRPTEHFNLLEADTPDLRDGCRQSARDTRLQSPHTAPSVVHEHNLRSTLRYKRSASERRLGGAQTPGVRLTAISR